MTRIFVKDNVKEIGGLAGLFRNKAGISVLIGVGFVNVALNGPRLFDGDLPPRRRLVLEGPQNLFPDPIVPLAFVYATGARLIRLNRMGRR